MRHLISHFILIGNQLIALLYLSKAIKMYAEYLSGVSKIYTSDNFFVQLPSFLAADYVNNP